MRTAVEVKKIAEEMTTLFVQKLEEAMRSNPTPQTSAKTTIKELAEKLGMKEKAVRRTLRDIGLSKPGSRWSWTEEKDVKKVMRKLKTVRNVG